MEQKIYIVGAHSRAQTLGVYLLKLYPNIKIEAYLYDNDEKNNLEINGIPVVWFDEDTKLHSDYPVYLGTRGVYHYDLIQKLHRMGMKVIIPLTPELDLKLRNLFLECYYTEKGESYNKLYNTNQPACIYIARSVFDKPLKQNYDMTKFQREIQAGAILTSDKICRITDDIGENISDRNKQFCELTVLYWIWKNAKQDVVGLEHYRRHFILKEDWYQQMKDRDIDVILPAPLYVMPSITANYKGRHVASDWDFMMDYMKRIYPEYYKEAICFFNTNLYSPCNMFIMRKEILNNLCLWLFPILFICAEHGGVREDVYQNRYPGFLSERLITLFFNVNRNKYKIVYADKNFLE